VKFGVREVDGWERQRDNVLMALELQSAAIGVHIDTEHPSLYEN